MMFDKMSIENTVRCKFLLASPMLTHFLSLGLVAADEVAFLYAAHCMKGRFIFFICSSRIMVEEKKNHMPHPFLLLGQFQLGGIKKTSQT